MEIRSAILKKKEMTSERTRKVASLKSCAKSIEPTEQVRWREGRRCCIFVAAVGLSLLNVRCLEAQPAERITQQKAGRVLWMARQAAKNGMQDLSLRSVREALGNGSPIPSLTDRGADDLDRDDAEQRMINTVESDLLILTDLWQQQQFDPTAVWETLRAVIVPDRRPDEIFNYQRMETADSLTMGATDRSVGSMLIRQTVALGRVEELRALLASRLSKPKAQLEAWLLLLQLALEEQNIVDARSRVHQFSEDLLVTAEPSQQLSVAITLLRAWSDPQLREALVPAMRSYVASIVDSLPDSKTDKCAVIMSLVLARESLRTGQTDAGLRFLGQADALVSRQAGDSASPLVDHNLNVATLLLQFGLEQQALAGLVDVASMESPPGSRSTQAISRAALLTRHFRQLPAKDRYELFRQGLIVKNRSALLNPTVEFTRTERPPAAFLELLPESIRATKFLDSAAAATDLVVSSVTEMIDAAREAGESDALRSELLKLQKEHHEASNHILTLFYLRNDMIVEAAGTLREIRDGLLHDAQKNSRGRVLSLDLLVAMKAAERPQTREMAIEMLDVLRRFEIPTGGGQIMANASAGRARAMALASASDTDPNLLFEQATPGLWLSAVNSSGAAKAQGIQPPLWLVHDGVITHQAGAENDSLYFPWPLGGTFEFSVSSLGDVQLDGDMGFDGLTCEALNSTGATTVSGLGIDNPNRRSLQLSQPGTYAQKSVRVTPTQLTFLVNGHPVYTEERTDHSSPWLSLFARSSKVGMWRFPEFSGSPEILREVALSNDPRMRGWSCHFFDQTRSSVSSDGQAVDEPTVRASALTKSFALDWIWNDGIITGRHRRNARRLDAMMDENLQGLLQYNRPLVPGETLTWEFDYSPGRIEVHPALGRLAFLIRRDGVYLHWMSVGAEEWNLIAADNEIVVRPDQRSPAEVPLQQGWNRASLSLQKNTASLSINGVVVYEHTLRPEDSRQFGLFHFCDQTMARARNIVLTGDWPESLTAQHLATLTSPRATSLTNTEHYVLDSILGDKAFSTDAVDIVRFANQLAPEQRYEFLLDWVLPGNDHPRWRIFGDLAPSDPVPSDPVPSDPTLPAAAFGSNPLSLPASAGNVTRQSTGGFGVSPALQLVRTARETRHLSELRTRVDAIPDSDASDQRARLAMLILLAIEEGRSAEAIPWIQQMSHITKSMIHFSESQIWPELIVAQQTLQTSPLRPDAMEMLRHVVSVQRVGGQPIDPAVATCLLSMIGIGELLEDGQGDNSAIGQLTTWQPFRITRADLRHNGLPQPLWVQREDGSIQHVSGFEDDMLCYPVPLSGDFEFECELLPVDGEHLLVGYGGFFHKPAAENKFFSRIPFGRDPTVLAKIRLVADQNSVWKYRLVVSQGLASVFVNDEQLTTDAVPATSPPWLCIRAASNPGAGIRRIRLTGTPTIPESFHLETSRDLAGWCRPYFGGGETFSPRNGIARDWRSEESVIVGPQRSALVGTKSESLLQYFRPLLEDGTITYSFLYEPGVALAHPALDRLAFVLDRDQGVLIHEITSGTSERCGLDPANAVAELQHQLARSLPLLENDWNVMKVRLEGNTITLILNDTEIFRRPLEKTNHRTFGLFHFRDETSARVRDLIWRGSWPTALPE